MQVYIRRDARFLIRWFEHQFTPHDDAAVLPTVCYLPLALIGSNIPRQMVSRYRDIGLRDGLRLTHHPARQLFRLQHPNWRTRGPLIDDKPAGEDNDGTHVEGFAR